ncbi:MAG: Mammalian cell entry related domain protein [Gemmatimonadetes bacterium]|nr:Mammalian cell entry related domain protein [Gemmatimonadota bacterium]
MSPRRNAGREVQTGLFVIIGVLAVVVALFLLTDPGTLRGRFHAYMRVSDAGGIRKGDPVLMRGVNIGRIRGFELTHSGVVVKLELEQEYPVPRDSKGVLRSNGLLGGVVADIDPGNSAQRLAEGDTIRTDASSSAASSSNPLDAIGPLATRADTVLDRAANLLSPQTSAAVGASAVQLQATLTQLNGLATEQRRQLLALTASLRRSAAGFEGAATRPELARSIARTDSITRKLDLAAASLQETATALRQTSASLNNVIGRIDRGEGTLGKLSRDESLYRNLDAAAASAHQLTDDIRNNPRKYINVRVF